MISDIIQPHPPFDNTTKDLSLHNYFSSSSHYPVSLTCHIADLRVSREVPARTRAGRAWDDRFVIKSRKGDAARGERLGDDGIIGAHHFECHDSLEGMGHGRMRQG